VPALRNTRRERFCQEIAGGKTLTKAYKAAGYKGDRRDASKLRHLPDISRRLGELHTEKAAIEQESHAVAVREAAVDKIRVLNQFACFAFSDLRNVCSWGPGGLGIKSSDDLTPEVVATVQEIIETERVDDDGNVTRRTRIKLVDKVAPLRDLAKHLGFYDGAGKMTQAEAQVFVRRLLMTLQRHIDSRTLDTIVAEIRDSGVLVDAHG